jgi:hypothetical protein
MAKTKTVVPTTSDIENIIEIETKIIEDLETEKDSNIFQPSIEKEEFNHEVHNFSEEKIRLIQKLLPTFPNYTKSEIENSIYCTAINILLNSK